MTYRVVLEAKAEALRFLQRVRELEKELEALEWKKSEWDTALHASRGTGAVRRSSMDLTRVLAKLRSYK
jgi:hypothetical protein